NAGDQLRGSVATSLSSIQTTSHAISDLVARATETIDDLSRSTGEKNAALASQLDQLRTVGRTVVAALANLTSRFDEQSRGLSTAITALGSTQHAMEDTMESRRRS